MRPYVSAEANPQSARGGTGVRSQRRIAVQFFVNDELKASYSTKKRSLLDASALIARKEECASGAACSRTAAFESIEPCESAAIAKPTGGCAVLQAMGREASSGSEGVTRIVLSDTVDPELEGPWAPTYLRDWSAALACAGEVGRDGCAAQSRCNGRVHCGRDRDMCLCVCVCV